MLIMAINCLARKHTGEPDPPVKRRSKTHETRAAACAEEGMPVLLHEGAFQMQMQMAIVIYLPKRDDAVLLLI